MIVVMMREAELLDVGVARDDAVRRVARILSGNGS